MATAATAASKPRVFITESGAIQIAGPSMALTGPTTSENIEVMRAFQKPCPGVAMTGEKDKADFVVRLEREVPSPVTPFVRGNKVAVFNRDADLGYTNSSRLLKPAVKGACAPVTARK